MKQKIKVLLADDDVLLRKTLPRQLSPNDFETSTVADGEQALAAVREEDFDVILLDVNLPGISGLEILSQVRQLEEHPEVVMLTADSSLTTGVEAMRRGAYDYITKPAVAEQLETIVLKAGEKRRIIKENQKLRAVVRSQNNISVSDPVYESPAMQRIYKHADIAARTDTTLLITGESGTGKDVLARWIHSRSHRAEQPFVSVNCGALPENLFESEFFGHEKGSFTGATSQKTGLIESADRSTLFLDEIGEMPVLMQVKLLHFLENGSFRRIGATRDRKTDVRVIAATNRPLEKDIADGKFRADLFYRLNIISFHLPPLRERTEDIPKMTEYFLEKFRRSFNRPNLRLSSDAAAVLITHEWNGNIRELKNTLERTVVLTPGDTIETIHGIKQFNFEKKQEAISESTENIPTLNEIEKQHIRHVLKSVGGRREKASAILGITSRTLYRKLKELNLDD